MSGEARLARARSNADGNAQAQFPFAAGMHGQRRCCERRPVETPRRLIAAARVFAGEGHAAAADQRTAADRAPVVRPSAAKDPFHLSCLQAQAVRPEDGDIAPEICRQREKGLEFGARFPFRFRKYACPWELHVEAQSGMNRGLMDVHEAVLGAEGEPGRAGMDERYAPKLRVPGPFGLNLRPLRESNSILNGVSADVSSRPRSTSAPSVS